MKPRSLLEVSLLAATATVGLVAIVQVAGDVAAWAGSTFETTVPQGIMVPGVSKLQDA